MSNPTGKLVRDKIPDIIMSKGEMPIIHVLDEAEYAQALTVKLHEECQEFSDEPSLEELADVMEVVLALARVNGGTDKLEAVRQRKADERGAFDKRIFLEGKS